MRQLNKKPLLIIFSLLLVSIIIVLATDNKKTDIANLTTNQSNNIPKTQTSEQPQVSSKPNETDQLLYLIEEEKLAHDVYQSMFQKYGAQVFGNILQSETTHQSKVLDLLNPRNIADPRSVEQGVFANDDLQNLYNQLITQGSISVTEAYKVGVIIEEKDIKDISTQLETSTATDIVSALEDLRRGSENHLRAFNRQLNRAN